MKIRFQKKEGDQPADFGIDINEVAMWHFQADGFLDVVLKGSSEPVRLAARDIGEDNFCFLITLLSQEFLDIDDLEFRTTHKASSAQ